MAGEVFPRRDGNRFFISSSLTQLNPLEGLCTLLSTTVLNHLKNVTHTQLAIFSTEKGYIMSAKSKREYIKAIYPRYHRVSKAFRRLILNEFCQVCGYHRKCAIRLLNGPPPQQPQPRHRRRKRTYGHQVISLLTAIWEAAGYPCSTRLKALVPLWLPWTKKHFPQYH